VEVSLFQRFSLYFGRGLMCVGVASLLSLSACANVRAHRAQMNYIHAETARHRYELNCEQVLDEVVSVLSFQGFPVKAYEPGEWAVETAWLSDDSFEPDNNDRRYVVEARSPLPGTCMITSNLSRYEVEELNTTRDLDFEWLVLQRLDVGAALQISSEADVIYASSGGS
jgi:hypothetical protein